MVKQWILAAALICGLLLPANAFARVWRDQKGNIINADFVKVDGGMIYLKPENKYAAGTPFPFYDFSEADQEFVRAILKKKGQEDRIPPPPPKKEDPNGIPGQPNVGGAPIPVTVVPNAASGTIPDIPFTNAPTASPVPIAVVPTVPPTYPQTPNSGTSPSAYSQTPNTQFGSVNRPGGHIFPQPTITPPRRDGFVEMMDEINKAAQAPPPESFEDKFLASNVGQTIFGLFLLVGGLYSLWGAATDNDWFFSFGKSRGFASALGRDGARIFYAILGLGLSVLGSLVALGIVVLKNGH